MKHCNFQRCKQPTLLNLDFVPDFYKHTSVFAATFHVPQSCTMAGHDEYESDLISHHDRKLAGGAENATVMWAEIPKSYKAALIFVAAVAIAGICMAAYNTSGRGSTHIDSGTGIYVVKYNKDHYEINALVESQNAKVGLDLASDDDSDGISPVRIVGGHIHGKFGFNNYSAVNSGEISFILNNKAKDTHLFDTASLQNTIESFASGDVSYALAGSSINVTSIYRYEHAIHWHAVVVVGAPLERVCGYVGVDSLPNGLDVEFDGVHAMQCADADADGFALLGGSTTVSLEGDHTVQLRLASNLDLQKRGVAPAELVHVQVTITVV